MKRRLLWDFLIGYMTFFVLSFFCSLFLVPKLLDYYLLDASQGTEYGRYLRSQFVDIQNVCYLLLLMVLLLSLIPLLVFRLKIYRPLAKIIEAAAKYTEDSSKSLLEYEKNNELGKLTASLNYLASSANTTGEYQKKFISNISHDFRSPLTSIKGYVEAMLDGTIPPEMQERYLGIVLSETERLNKLTDGLLLLNSMDGNGACLDLISFDILSVIRKTVDSFEGTYQKKNLQVITTFPDHPVSVYADMGKIQQVLYNLLDNAIKFSYPGSEIQISVAERKRQVFVSIKDHGEGISKEHLTKIWDRFYKTDTSRGRDKKGTGLGLSIVREIIRSHHQNINVISTEGVGTEFIFTLSRAESMFRDR